MTTHTATGFSNQTLSFQAGQEAATKAILKTNNKADLVLLFCSAKYDPTEVLKGVLSVTGDAMLAGGAALGVFNNDNLSSEGYECAVTIIESDEIEFKTFAVNNLNEDESKAGEQLGSMIQEQSTDNSKGLLVFYETAKTAEPPMLNFATPLFSTLEKYLVPQIVCAGSGLLGNMQLTNGFQFFNNQVLHQSAVAVLINGNCGFRTTIMHGCKPASSYHTITKCHGPVIFEIDNKPALDVITDLLGPNASMEWKDFPLFVTLGVNKGDKYGPYVEENYANRLCLAVIEEQKALVMFEPDLQVGDEVQLMHRSVTLDYLKSGLDKLKSGLQTDDILFYFYIDCAGRSMPYTGGNLEDADELRQLIGSKTPFMGFYSGVEIAKMGNHLQALDWTGVLCALTK